MVDLASAAVRPSERLTYIVMDIVATRPQSNYSKNVMKRDFCHLTLHMCTQIHLNVKYLFFICSPEYSLVLSENACMMIGDAVSISSLQTDCEVYVV